MKKRALVFMCVVLAWLVNMAEGASSQVEKKEAAIMSRWAGDVDPGRVHAEYPRPQMERAEWLNLNGIWEMAFAQERGAPPFGRQLAGEILVPFPVESALSGVMQHADRLWYRRTFEVPEKWRGRRLLLHFGAVDWETRVWVNGRQVGEHRGGYDGFTFDITDYLRVTGQQEIVVGVWDPTSDGTQPRGKQVLEPKGIWYTPTTGIWQTVWLEPVPDTYIDKMMIVPDADRRAVEVEVETGGARADGLVVRVTAERDGSTADGSDGLPVRLNLGRAHDTLWTPDHPQLYDLTIELRDGDRVLDSVHSYFALRKIDVGPDESGVQRILLNGEPIFNIGTLDQGFWPDGLYTAPTDQALKYDVEMTKKLGFNTIRKHVKVEPDRWYYWCDRLGLLVWQDMPSGDAYAGSGVKEIDRTAESSRQFEVELKRMIDGLGNHPSIVMWVVFNEGWGQFETDRFTRLTRELDPTRLVNAASGWHDLGGGDVHDIHSYPGPAAPTKEERRAGVLGEFGGLGLGVDGHTWTEHTWGYRGTADSAELTRKYEQLMRGVWDLKDRDGLSAAIYTQITDVETECNGLLTYDREITKVDVQRVANANRGRLPRMHVVVDTAREQPVQWKYVREEPGEGWEQPDYDDAHWNTGMSGFGTGGTPGAVVGTTWSGAGIWLRREFVLKDKPRGDLRLFVHHDEDAEIYINGVLAAKLAGYTTSYEDVAISETALASLGKGRNTFAVHCRQTRGGQYIDVGLIRIEPWRGESRK